MDKEKMERCGIDYEQGLLYFAGEKELYQEYFQKFLGYDFYQDAIAKWKAGEKDAFHDLVQRYRVLIKYISHAEILKKLDQILEEEPGEKTAVEKRLKEIGQLQEEIRGIWQVREVTTEIDGIDF